MLVYERGGFFSAHRDTEKAHGMIATLSISTIGVAKWKKGACRAENMAASPSRLDPVNTTLSRSARLSRLALSAATRDAFPRMRASSWTPSRSWIVTLRRPETRSRRSSR